MKLDKNCIKDLLLEIEEKQEYRTPITESVFTRFDIHHKYDKFTILYTLDKLNEAYIIKSNIKILNGKFRDFEIKDITWQGHQFLESIRYTEEFNDLN